MDERPKDYTNYIPGDMKENYKESFLEDLPNKPEEIQTEIEANIFIDSSLVSLLHNYKSVTGCVIMIGGMLYKFASKRQKAVATSTFSAEFIALRYAIEEAHALRLLLKSLGIKLKKINIYSDSESILKSAAQPKNELNRRHVAIYYHVVREAYAIGLVDFFNIAGVDNPSDVLTKTLGRINFHKHVDRLLEDLHMKD